MVFFAIILTYVNYAPEPTTMMIKLIGISLVTLLVMLGLISGYALEAYRQADSQVRRAELAHIPPAEHILPSRENQFFKILQSLP